MPPRILTPLGVTYVGYCKDTVEAFFGSVSEYQTSLRMPRDLSLKATRLREDFGCSDNDIFVVALAEWMDIVDGLRAEGPRAHVPEEEPRIPEAPGAGPAPDEAVAGDFMQTLDDRLTRPRPWTVEDRGALKDFRDRTTDALVLILVGRGRMTPTALIGGLPVLLKLEACLTPAAGAASSTCPGLPTPSPGLASPAWRGWSSPKATRRIPKLGRPRETS